MFWLAYTEEKSPNAPIGLATTDTAYCKEKSTLNLVLALHVTYNAGVTVATLVVPL